MKNPHICEKSQRFLKFKNLPGLCKGLAKVLQLLFYISINDKKGLLINGDDPLTCRPIKKEGSRVLHFQTMNLALLTEWVDMMLEVLKDNYGPWMDLERSAAPVRGAWALRHILFFEKKKKKKNFKAHFKAGASTNPGFLPPRARRHILI